MTFNHLKLALILLVLSSTNACVSLSKRARQIDEEKIKSEISDFKYTMPFEVAWNTIYSKLRAKAPITIANVSRGIIKSSWIYGNEDHKTFRIEQKARASVEFMSKNPVRFEFSVEKWERKSKLGGEKSEWQQLNSLNVKTSPKLHNLLIESEINWRENTQINASSYLVHKAILKYLAQKHYEIEENSESEIATGWKTSKDEIDDLTFKYREKINIFLKNNSELTSVVTESHKERKALKGEEETKWVKLNPDSLRLELLEHLEKRFGLLKTRALKANVQIDSENSEPDLPDLLDPLDGEYSLILESAIASPTKSNGKEWDIKLGQAIMVAGLAGAVSTGQIQVIGSARKLSMFGNQISGPEFPDLFAEISINRNMFRTRIVRDSFGAAWMAKMRIRINKNDENVVYWKIYDADIREHDLIGSGSFRLSEIANNNDNHTLKSNGGQIEEISFRFIRIGN